MLSEQELATLHDEWVEYRCVDPISVVSRAHQDIHSLLDHIEAQEETLQEYRETLASQYAAIVEDNDLRQQLETAQAEAAAMRLELGRLDTRFFVCPECDRETPGVHVDDCALARSLSGTAGQALLDELARLRAVAEAALRFEREVDKEWLYSVTGSDVCDAGEELLLRLAACDYGDEVLVKRVQAGELAGYLKEQNNAK